MRWREAFIYTLREDPRDAEAASHKLLIRAGFIRKLSAGVYSYLPLGLRSLERVSQIIREEMKNAGATELVMPALHPAELWKQTGRYETLGEDMFSLKNRSDFEYVLGPTHEEIVTQIVADSVKSYKDLPFTLYQIQGKFRDEARPRFGIIRSKEFLMKDAYSFDRDAEGLDKSYEVMRTAYQKIFKRTGIEVLEVNADPGIMGGKVSHEFMVPAPFGEDKIARCGKCGLVTSLEIAKCPTGAPTEKAALKPMESFSTPNQKTIEELTKAHGFKASQLLKSIIYAADQKVVMVCLRGDHEVNETKLKKFLGVKSLELASAEVIEKVTGAPLGFSGPVGVKGMVIILDTSAQGANWITGANKKDEHLRNVNLGRDFEAAQTGDIRYTQAGDICEKCGVPITIETAMELGHIFKLGTRYSAPLAAQYLDEKGEKRDIIMGCYGIGVNRILASAVEQFNDEKGIRWPKALAPYDIELITLGISPEVMRQAEELEKQLTADGFQVLLDDRDERAGVKFNDADLIGIPLQVIVSERNLKEKLLEVKNRQSGKAEKIALQDSLAKIKTIHQSLV